MLLFQVWEPHGSRQKLEPGLDFELDDSGAYLPLVKSGGQSFKIPFDENLTRAAKITPGKKIYCAEYTRKNVLVLKLDPNAGYYQLEEHLRTKRLPAMVVLGTLPGAGGHLRLSANSFSETVGANPKQGFKQVQKVWDYFPSAGVEVLNSEHMFVDPEGYCRWEDGWGELEISPPIVLSMLPGACFRVWRDGDLSGAPSNFLVSWNGKQLFTVVPKSTQHDKHLDLDDQLRIMPNGPSKEIKAPVVVVQESIKQEEIQA